MRRYTSYHPIESLTKTVPIGIHMSTVPPISSSSSSTPFDSERDRADHQAPTHLPTPPKLVQISQLGRSLSGNSTQGTDKNADINNSDLPDAVKSLLKMIRELRVALEKKLQALREVQADTSLTPAQRKQRMEKIQTEISGLSSALVGATQSLERMISGDMLTDDQKIMAGVMAM